MRRNLITKIILLLALFSPVISKAQSTLLPGVQNPVPYYNGSTNTMYIYLPWDYYVSGKKYPIIFFFSGSGEKGNGGSDLSKLLNQGLPSDIASGKPPYTVRSNGDTLRYIVTSIQTPTSVQASELSRWIQTIQTYNLNIDTTRIYFTGLSIGGKDVLLYANSVTLGWKPAAIVSMSTATGTNTTPTPALKDVPIYLFQGDNDGTAGQLSSELYFNLVSAYPDGQYKLTEYSGGHCCWTTYYDPNWYDSLTSRNYPGAENLNIYGWMDKYTVKYDSSNYEDIQGVTDKWYINFAQSLGYLSYPAAPYNNITALTTSNLLDTLNQATSVGLSFNTSTWAVGGNGSVTGNNTGLYPDNAMRDYFYFGRSSPYTVTGTLSGLNPNYAYAINFFASSNWAFTADNGHTVYTINGRSDSIYVQNNLNQTMTFTGLVPDASGNISFTMSKGVDAGAGYINAMTLYEIGNSSNIAPTVNAGSDQTLSAGTTSTTLSGSANTENGNIVSYQWTTTSGATITSPTSANTTVTGLQDNTSYTFTLTVTDDSSMTSSADVTVTVKEGEVIPDTTSYQIPLSPYAKFWNGDTVFYQLNNLNDQDSANNIIDEQTGTPYSTFFYKAQGAHGNLIVVIDLGGYYKLTDIEMFANYGTAQLYIEHGSPLNWSTDTIKVGTGAGRFGYYDVPTSVYTRYLRLSYGSGNQKFKEMRLYGYLVRDSLSRTEPVADLVKPTNNTMGQFIGFNQVGPNEVDSVGQLMRHYLQNEWVDTTKATGTHNIDSLKFVFNVHTTWKGSYSPTYYFFPYTAGDGPVKASTSLNWGDYFDAFQGPPVYLSGTNLYKPIDTAIFHQRDPLNPHQYTRLSRMAWTYAAMLGKNTYPEDSMQTPYPDLSGLDRRKYIENGNEYNGSWKTGDDHFTPHEFVAYSSAFYDGDNNTMGNRMGIKNADPDMQVVMGGTAGADTAYLKGLQYYSYYTRKNKSVPFDIVNFHTYPTNGSNGTGTDAHAYSPEQYFNRGQIQAYMKVAKTVMPDKPVWLTEWGYDRNGRSSLSVPPISGLDSAQVQAQWIARWWFLLSFSGIDRSTIFQLHNDALSTMYDSVGISVFNTTGLTDGHYVGNAYSSEYATSYYAYPAYYFQRAIWLNLYNYKPDSIIYSNHDSIWVYKYRNVNEPDSVAYVIWSGTQTNRITSDYSLRTGHANTQVSFTKLEDKQMDGVTSTPTSNADGNLPIVISETPVMVFTTEGVNGGQLVENEEPTHTPPTVNAGDNQTLDAGSTTTNLSGIATAGDGSIISYKWSKVGTNEANIVSPNNQNTSITGLTDGETYNFRLTVTDSNGLTGTDDVTVTIKEGGSDEMEVKLLLYIKDGKLIKVNVKK